MRAPNIRRREVPAPRGLLGEFWVVGGGGGGGGWCFWWGFVLLGGGGVFLLGVGGGWGWGFVGGCLGDMSKGKPYDPPYPNLKNPGSNLDPKQRRTTRNRKRHSKTLGNKPEVPFSQERTMWKGSPARKKSLRPSGRQEKKKDRRDNLTPYPGRVGQERTQGERKPSGGGPGRKAFHPNFWLVPV